MQPDSLNRFKQVLAGSEMLCNHFELFFAALCKCTFPKTILGESSLGGLEGNSRFGSHRTRNLLRNRDFIVVASFATYFILK